jgi:hypothetical protein
MKTKKWVGLVIFTTILVVVGSAVAEVKTVPPMTNSTAAQIIFHGTFPQHLENEKEPKLIYSANLAVEISVTQERVRQSNQLNLRLVQGKADEILFSLFGTGEIYEVTAKGMSHWSVRRSADGERFLVVVPDEKSREQAKWSIHVASVQELDGLPSTVRPLVILPTGAAMFDGVVELKTDELVEATIDSATGLQPLKSSMEDEVRFRFSGEAWSMTMDVNEADPDLRVVRFESFDLTGNVEGDVATFKLTGFANVRHPEGGTLDLLSGAVALTDYREHEHAQMEFVDGRYRVKFAANGVYPIELEFNAQVGSRDGWNTVSFAPAAAPLRPVTVSGFSMETTVQFTDAAEAKRSGDRYVTFLPAGGVFDLRWQERKPEQEVKLFYSVSGMGQVTVSPGLMRQTVALDYKVMQGELRELTVELENEGSVTRVEGRHLLTWRPEEVDGRRLLTVRLNTPQRGSYQLTIHTQTPLGAFPLRVKPVRFVPVDAIRYGGHIQLTSQGAVRLEAVNAPGLAQISPQRLPEVKSLPTLTGPQLAQAFAFRFSGPQFGLEIQADNVLPELAVSQMLVYRLGETEMQIDAELELEIREAPLREFTMSVPEGFTVAQLKAPHLSDYHVSAGADGEPSALRIQFGRPLIGRQVLQLQLTRSHNSPPETWTLPTVAPRGVKSLRGFIGVSADAGLR